MKINYISKTMITLLFVLGICKTHCVLQFLDPNTNLGTKKYVEDEIKKIHEKNTTLKNEFDEAKKQNNQESIVDIAVSLKGQIDRLKQISKNYKIKEEELTAALSALKNQINEVFVKDKQSYKKIVEDNIKKSINKNILEVQENQVLDEFIKIKGSYHTDKEDFDSFKIDFPTIPIFSFDTVYDHNIEEIRKRLLQFLEKEIEQSKSELATSTDPRKILKDRVNIKAVQLLFVSLQEPTLAKPASDLIKSIDVKIKSFNLPNTNLLLALNDFEASLYFLKEHLKSN